MSGDDAGRHDDTNIHGTENDATAVSTVQITLIQQNRYSMSSICSMAPKHLTNQYKIYKSKENSPVPDPEKPPEKHVFNTDKAQLER